MWLRFTVPTPSVCLPSRSATTQPTCSAATGVHVIAAVTSGAYDRAAAMNPLRALASTDLFSGASEDELAPLAPALRQRSFARGTYLFHVGDPPTATYVVLSGLVKICYT